MVPSFKGIVLDTGNFPGFCWMVAKEYANIRKYYKEVKLYA